MRELFQRFARSTAHAAGSPWAFSIAVAVTLVWAILGPAFGYSDSWQLVINTGTTIATFLAVFLIQHTQNHDSQVVQLKLDELIRAVKAARNELLNLEALPEADLAALQKEFEALQARRQTKKRRTPRPQKV